MGKLSNAKHEEFCNQYIVDLNGTQAYRRTYPDIKEKPAEAAASRLLSNVKVQERIEELQGKRAKRTMVTQDRVIQELSNIAFGHLGLVCEQDKDGDLTLRQIEEMEEGQVGTLHSVKQSKHYSKDGNLLNKKHQFTMHDKMKALELLSKHLGILDGSGADKNNKENAEGRLRGAVDRVNARLRGRKPRAK